MFSWIRCEGKGSFLNSLAVKQFGEAEIGFGKMLLVVDLQQCTGMDSTFMGTLAGLASRISEKGGVLQVAFADAKNQSSLEDLGLNYLMLINPEAPIWLNSEKKVWSLLHQEVPNVELGDEIHSQHVLDTHQTLCEVYEENQQKFSSVVNLLEKS